MNLEKLLTEARNPLTTNIDKLSTLDIVTLINEEDRKVPIAVNQELPKIALAADTISQGLKKGGRLIYLGAGTSGRLGVLDAVECPPTYGTPPELVQGVIAGGRNALVRSIEGAEDSLELAAEDLKQIHLSPRDVVVGIAASGRTPYVLGGLTYSRQLGCATIAIACSPDSEIGRMADIAIELLTGPEVVTGSTRMKAGTAQKLVLNMLTTTAMIKLGKVYSNLMVDVQATNFKLKQRAKRIVATITEASTLEVEQALSAANGSVKTAIVMLLAGISAEAAAKSLELADGFVGQALKMQSNQE